MHIKNQGNVFFMLHGKTLSKARDYFMSFFQIIVSTNSKVNIENAFSDTRKKNCKSTSQVIQMYKVGSNI